MKSVLFLALLGIFPAATLAQSGRVIPCECRDTFGNLHDVGEQVCLTVGGRSFMARCAMAQNVTIWRDTGDTCLSS
ncbi:hypothetical protein [Jannaschia pohangensis]|uniref:Cysteine rich repeat-containing protein n=1 Tax=Jannaschia pohangensis TaxID=390807 RepID=A0A1I3S5Y1_9RHOB|nr:hypothetical protein [Jannaschia pohangensis]SFJ54253.1 hypothetical protein SAMN04488095_3035 [Jannaschia pohangensis]